jgi:hypothetical protein
MNYKEYLEGNAVRVGKQEVLIGNTAFETKEKQMSDQEIRLKCVEIAASVNESSPNTIVQDATLLYNFVIGATSESKA